ncbi:hypothetical protein NLG97_g1743 [Lecanicillium saksenae]|uniref:Uncharacterized protein n=1 Tax=Lecanicillium saksenae TaxID=468837 RepID=A0ACC1R2X6_9HYPO|nr:hypothetical protein NLG97_g1743 [Lecanicillium saksenae]
MQERSILLPSSSIPWDEDHAFGLEQRRQHDMAHALWKKFTTVVMLNEQVRVAEDARLRDLLTRIRQGVRTPWETGITVVTPLNRNRWNLNKEAILAFRKQWQAPLYIFVSEHKWKDGQPTEEEALMMLGLGNDSAIPVPGVFMFVPGMPIVVNRNTHQGLKLVNGSSYKLVEVILDKAYPGYCIDFGTVLYFGPPAGLLLVLETTGDFRFLGIPPTQGIAMCASVCLYRLQGASKNIGSRGDRAAGSLDGIMLLSKVWEQDLVGNNVPAEMAEAELRLEQLSETIREAESSEWYAEKSN